MLVDDIHRNHSRIHEIFRRIEDGDEETVWKMLAREGLISDDQFLKLQHVDGADVDKISDVLKTSKIGQGISFLPTALSELRNTLKQLYEKFKEEGSEFVRKKLSPILDELRRLGAMTDDQYSTIQSVLSSSVS